jgi:G8 domain
MRMLATSLLLIGVWPAFSAEVPLLRSARSGAWSDPAIWEGGRVPAAGDRVQVRTGHAVTYDVNSPAVIRSVHVAGTLAFAPDRDTRLDVGLIKVQPGDDPSEDGFDCEAHLQPPDPSRPRPALEVGTPDRPVEAGHTALIRLTPVAGLDPKSCPAIVCCGGRLDLHGAPLNHTWAKLGTTAAKGSAALTLAEPVTGWRPGDRVIVTATTRQHKGTPLPGGPAFRESVRDQTQTEERAVESVDGAALTLDRPLEFDHRGEGDTRGEVANLSRNVVIESADPDGAHGHTMYHRHSAGSISYAEFRHLGKPGVLGRYSLHFHLCGDTLRGSSVVGASVWDSGNRWITVHGTNYLVVRDCVGYRSRGHGFFLEDGTEVDNVFDRNLAVQALSAKPLPEQILPYDKNDGSGFWWANCLNTFTRNVACECDEYGYFFQAPKTADFDPVLTIRQPDGSRKPVDVRTLPFVRFEDNEAHCQRRHAFNLGGGVPFGKPNVDGVGPDVHHPFVIHNARFWDVHWAFHPVSPSVQVDGLTVREADYAVWRPVYHDHVYRGLSIDSTRVPEFTPEGRRPSEKGYPGTLEPVDDRPPATVVTHVGPLRDGRRIVRGTTSDDGTVRRVAVNGREARAVRPNFAEWEIELDGAAAGGEVAAHAEDAAGNVEPRPHRVSIH